MRNFEIKLWGKCYYYVVVIININVKKIDPVAPAEKIIKLVSHYIINWLPGDNKSHVLLLHMLFFVTIRH